jgi:hypothetical protein
VTTGDDQYRRDSVTADIGDQLAVQVWYYNRENVDSGIFAESLLVRVEPPIGRHGPDHISATVAGRNTNQVGLRISVIIPENASIDYVPGSTTWRHNPSASDEEAKYVTEVVDDKIVDTGVILEDAGPCLNCEASLRLYFNVVSVT